jgi:hypothetical protein
MSRRRQLHLGNAITIVVAGRPRRANVKTWLPPVGLFRWQGHSGTYGEFNLRDEGVHWIRDHHEADAREVRALLAAHALTGEP